MAGTVAEKPLPKKIMKAKIAYHDLIDANRKLHNHKIIANQPLPKRKQKKFDDLVAQCLTKQFNASQAYEAALRKLSESERKVLAESLGLI